MVEMRGSGGGVTPPPKCARKCANFRNLKANVQILDRKTPPPKWFTLFRLLPTTEAIFTARTYVNGSSNHNLSIRRYGGRKKEARKKTVKQTVFVLTSIFAKTEEYTSQDKKKENAAIKNKTYHLTDYIGAVSLA